MSSDGKASACNVGDLGSVPGSEISPGEGNGNPLQYSCLENSMDGGAFSGLQSMGSQSWTRLSNFTYLLTYYIYIAKNVIVIVTKIMERY